MESTITANQLAVPLPPPSFVRDRIGTIIRTELAITFTNHYESTVRSIVREEIEKLEQRMKSYIAAEIAKHNTQNGLTFDNIIHEEDYTII